MRKIIQIAFDSPYLYALCDDGTIWVKGDTFWEQIDTDLEDENIITGAEE